MDFVAEWMELQLLTPDVTHEYWTMYFDWSVMGPSSGARVVLISLDGSRLRYAICLYFLASNNTMEYEASSTDYASPSSSTLHDSMFAVTQS